MKTQKSKLTASISAIFLLSNISAVNATVFSKVNATANQTLTIESGESVYYNLGFGNAVSANGNNSFVSATDTSLNNSGNNNNTVNALNGGVVNLNDVKINTSGTLSFGITSQKGGIVNATNVIIETSGASSSGVHGAGGELNLNSVQINTTGFKTYGVIIDAAGSVVNLSDTSVSTTGNQSHGITASAGELDIQKSTIETFGDLARGVYVSGNANVIADDLVIKTHGNDRADGLVVSGNMTGSNIYIVTDGSNSYGITMAENGKLNLSKANISSQDSAINFTVQETNAGANAEFENTNIYAKNSIVTAGNSVGNVTFSNTRATSESEKFARAGDNSVLNIAVKDNSLISGSLIANASSSISLSLENQSQWSGHSLNSEKIEIDNSSNWNVTNNSDSNDLINNGNVIFGNTTSSDMSNDFISLTTKNLSGNGTFDMRVEGLAGDFLNVTDSVSGNHNVLVKGSGNESSDGYHLIHAQGSQNDSFGLQNGVVDLGSYEYSLSQKGDDWYLTQNFTTTPSVDAVLSIASAPQFIFDGEMQNLRFRKGDLKNNKGDNAGVWGRYLTNNTRAQSQVGTYKLQQDGFEIGSDKVFLLDSGQLVLGGLTSYTSNTLKNSRGGDTNIGSFSIGGYATYFSNTGFYLDSVVKANQFNNKLNAKMSDGSYTHSDYHQNAIGTSLEGGYLLSLADEYFIEPYMRASYFIAQSKSIELDNGMSAKFDNSKSLKGEVGTSFGKTFLLNNGADITPYARIAIEREFIKNNGITINSVNNFNNDFSGNIGKYGVGLNSQVTKSTAIFAEVDYRKGNKIESPIMGNVGFRILF